MRRFLLLVGVMIWVAFGFTIAQAQDNGMPDTLYLEVWGDGGQTGYPADVMFPMFITNDIPDPLIDSIAGIVIPLCFYYTNPFATIQADKNNLNVWPYPDLDNSIFRHLPTMDTLTATYRNFMMDYSYSFVDWDTRILDLTTAPSDHFWLRMLRTGTSDQSFPGGSRVLTATITFTIEDSTMICIDSCFWPPNGRLLFSRSDAVGYIPQIWDDYAGTEWMCQSIYTISGPRDTLTGEAEGDEFGYSVSGAGDVNNDGYDDLIVGACRNDAGGTDAGRAYVYSGQTGGLLWTFTGEAADDRFGISVSGAGDVNNDGYDDLIVGADGNDAGGDNAGRAYVYSGQTGALLWTFTGEAAGDRLGHSVSGAGDVNNDNHADLIVGAYGNDAGGSAAGRAYVYSGQTGGLLWTFTGEAESDLFGYSVSGAGDVNNDGFDDLIVGAYGNDAGGDNAGRAYVYSGQSGSLLCTFDGEAAVDDFGYSVSGAGDVNNDGSDEVIVGAPRNDAGGTNAGRAYVFSCQVEEPYTCGDLNGDGIINVGDIVYLVSYLYKSGPAPAPECVGDVNSDGIVNVGDIVYLVSYLYKGGPAPDPGCCP